MIKIQLFANKNYGITQDPITKDFIIIMDQYIPLDSKTNRPIEKVEWNPNEAQDVLNGLVWNPNESAVSQEAVSQEVFL